MPFSIKYRSKRTVSLSANESLARIMVKNGDLQASLQGGDESVSLGLFDKGVSRGSWMLMENGINQIDLKDKSGQIRGKWTIGLDGHTAIRINDKSGVTRASLGNTAVEMIKTGEERILAESSLVLFDKDSKVIFQVWVSLRREN